MKPLVLLVFLTTPCIALAELAESWMKKFAPNELGSEALASESCPMNAQDVLDLVNGEFLRARLKPVNADTTSLFIRIEVQCYQLPSQPDMYAASIHVSFGTTVGTAKVLYADHGARSIDIQTPTSLRDRIEEYVNESITIYLKANFGSD